MLISEIIWWPHRLITEIACWRTGRHVFMVMQIIRIFLSKPAWEQQIWRECTKAAHKYWRWLWCYPVLLFCCSKTCQHLQTPKSNSRSLSKSIPMHVWGGRRRKKKNSPCLCCTGALLLNKISKDQIIVHLLLHVTTEKSNMYVCMSFLKMCCFLLINLGL